MPKYERHEVFKAMMSFNLVVSEQTITAIIDTNYCYRNIHDLLFLRFSYSHVEGFLIHFLSSICTFMSKSLQRTILCALIRLSTTHPMPEKLYISYNIVHKLCKKAAEDIKQKGTRVDLIIAIGGGGFIPARILRSFLKDGKGNIPIQAIGLSLYEDMGNTGEDKIGKEVIRTQWLDLGNLSNHLDTLIGKNVIIVDEVDDTRTTLHYAVTELQNDVAKLEKELGLETSTKFLVFVLHNKNKPKKADLPSNIMDTGRYIVGQEVEDAWIAYPWDAADIDEHTELAKKQGNY